MNVSKEDDIYEHSLQCVEYRNGKRMMYAAVVPLAVALKCIQIKPAEDDWFRIGYIRIIYKDDAYQDMIDYYRQPIKNLVNDIESKKDFFQLRISFFINSTKTFRPIKTKNIKKIQQFFGQNPPVAVTKPDEKQPNMRVVTIAYTPSDKKPYLILYSGFNLHGNVEDLFEKIYAGYTAYTRSLDLSW